MRHQNSKMRFPVGFRIPETGKMTICPNSRHRRHRTRFDRLLARFCRLDWRWIQFVVDVIVAVVVVVVVEERERAEPVRPTPKSCGLGSLGL
jgi:hypothetical protein